MENKFNIETFNFGDIEIEPNYKGYRDNKGTPIRFNVGSERVEATCGLTLEQTKELIATLQQIVEYIEWTPCVRDYVVIKEGRFSGLVGVIADIDSVRGDVEVSIYVSATRYNEKFYVYTNLENIERYVEEHIKQSGGI